MGYKRINKKTGKEVDKEDIVKGLAYEDDHYVVLTDEEVKAAYPKTTQTIEIECFVKAGEIPFVYLDRPYYLAPVGKGDKVYALPGANIIDLTELLQRSLRRGAESGEKTPRRHAAAARAPKTATERTKVKRRAA